MRKILNELAGYVENYDCHTKRHETLCASGSREAADLLVHQTAPSGSGIDCGTKINWTKTKKNKIVLTVEYHHMNDNGFYCGWTYHEITFTPDLVGVFNISVSGRDYRDIKDYLTEVYATWASCDIPLVQQKTA
jgi:hypothetical protein